MARPIFSMDDVLGEQQYSDDSDVEEDIGKFFRVKICAVLRGQNLRSSATLPLCGTEKV